MDDRTVYISLASRYLMVKKGREPGRKYLLTPGVTLMGRDPACAIAFAPEDTLVSRRHASLTVTGSEVQVEDLDSRNGILVNGQPARQAVLNPGAELDVGGTVFVLYDTTVQDPKDQAQAAGAAPDGAKPGRKRIMVLAGLLALAVAALAYVATRTGSEAPSGQDAGKASTASPGTAAPASPSDTVAAPAAPSSPSAAPVSQAPAAPSAPSAPSQPSSPAKPEAAQDTLSPEAEKASAHHQEGLFFYNSGKLGKAVEQWEKANAVDPANESAAKWLARARAELDQLLDKHYRQGQMALRYMRRDEAREAFLFVVENARDPNDTRAKDAARKLEELGER
jgi:pSer/pThr/pTyr-binding forkhead associated (FHA) protein